MRRYMKLDLLYEIDCPYPWPDKPHPYAQREVEQRAYAESIAQVRLADRFGFNTAWFVEHHFRVNRSHCPAPEVVIGALSQITENIRLGFGVTLMPHQFTHPARVAEKVAVADILTNGRVEWGTGRSTPMEQTAFHVPAKESRDEMFEAISTVVEMWESETYECDKPFLEFPERVVLPKPVQDPHPPCWMAATSPDSTVLAGKYGLGALAFAPLSPLESTAQKLEQYRQAQREQTPLTRVTNNKFAGYTLVHCAESKKAAVENGIWDAVWWWYRNLAEFTLQWEVPNHTPEDRDRLFPMMKAIAEAEDRDVLHRFDEEDMIIVGDPDQVTEKMIRYAELGVDQILCFINFGKLPHEAVLRSIELLGTEVIPEVERHRARV
jgi:alkanesulfonate monooxygenase SsuD/methylene tetrahydromethanopterin reductase-like flavin-dependent oxidoreductase (luciferase family)